MISTTQLFLKSCNIAAKKDDGKISKEEEKALKKIEKATTTFIKELEKAL